MKKLWIIFSIVVLALILAVGFMVFGPTISNPHQRPLYVPTKGTLTTINDSLVHNKIGINKTIFNFLAKRVNLSDKIKPGKYAAQSGSSIFSLVRKLKNGQQEPVKVVLNLLRTKEELAGRLSKYLEADSISILNFLNSDEQLRPYNVDTTTLLAVVIPDTYIYFWTADMTAVFKKLNTEYNKFWNQERVEKAESLHLTPIQVATLASIIEEETNRKEDMPKIASVYLNRLQKGMPLQADPTIKFAMRDFTLNRIYHKYLTINSPYNTYINKGLPPGPISMASRTVIDAILNAPQTNYLYFVAKPDFSGYSTFATDYTEHIKNAQAYQKALDSLTLSKENGNK